MARHNLIAVLGAEVNEAYQAELWKGIRDEADRHDKYLICFMGSRSGIPYRETHISYPFYGLAHSDNFDGVIIVSSTISTYMDPEKVKALFDSRPHIPKISIGLPIDGAGSVCVDSRKGMGDMVEHLVSHHGCRKFALIAGPRLHPESEQRRTAVETFLKEKGLTLRESSIFYGRFDKESGVDGIAALYREDRDFDAILCLNDRMAIGALEELQRRGMRVPEDVLVTGFDGIKESAYCSPPLATVVQPLRRLGQTSVEELYRLLEGGMARDLDLESHILLRDSCSCNSILEKDIENETGSLLSKGNEKKDLWEENTRLLVHGFLEEEERGHLLRNVGITLSGSFDLDTLFPQLARGLYLLGFEYAYLVLYEKGDEGLFSRLAFELRRGQLVTEDHMVFSSGDILPDIGKRLGETNCRNWMFTPLAFQDRVMGHLLLPGDHQDTEIYETLTRQISSSLQGAILWEQVRNHERDLVEEVRKRTVELTRVNGNLRKEIEQRKILEEEVLQISQHTMERIGQDLHDDLCQFLAGTSLRLGAVSRKLKGGEGELAGSLENIQIMINDAILRAKRLVKGLIPLGIKEEGFNHALESLCREMSQSYGIAIDYRGSTVCDNLTAEKTTELYRIVQEALNNGVKHSGSREILVRVTRSGPGPEDRGFEIVVQDRGCGFIQTGENREKEKGMGLRIMKYRGRRIGVTVDIRSDLKGTVVRCSGLGT